MVAVAAERPSITTISAREVSTISPLPPILKQRNPRERFTSPEKKVLSELMKEVWAKQMWGERQDIVPVSDMEQIVIAGSYPDFEPKGLLSRDWLSRNGTEGGRRLDMLAHLQTPDDVLRFRYFASRLGNPPMTLATMSFPLERGDRPVMQNEGEEMVLLETLVSDLAGAGVQRIIRADTHSPVFSLSALKNGIAVIDVSPLPLMLWEAIDRRLLERGSLAVAVTGDDGAKEMGLSVTNLARSYGFDMAEPVKGRKSKAGGKTEISFASEDLVRIKGHTIVVPEDLLATGGTLKDLYFRLMAACVKNVIILVTYPIVAGNALQHLGNKNNLTIVTTDGRTPQHDISQEENFIQIPVKGNFARLLWLDRAGINLWSEEGQKQMGELGFCLAPWLTYN